MPLEELLAGVWQRIVEMSPQIIAAAMVLTVGWTVGRVVARAFSIAFKRSDLDRQVKNTVMGRALEKSGVSSAVFFDQLIRWSIYSFTILTAVDLLNIEAASLLVARIFEYLPHLVGGLLILFGGLIVSDLIGNAIGTLGAEVGVEFSIFISRPLKILLYYIVIVTALSTLGIDVSILQTFASAMAWGVAIAFGIAFGLGLKDSVARNAEKWMSSAVVSGKKEQSGGEPK